MTTTSAESEQLTVEQRLAELREMFPGSVWKVCEVARLVGVIRLYIPVSRHLTQMLVSQRGNFTKG